LPIKANKVVKSPNFYKGNDSDSDFERQNPLEMLVIWRNDK